MNSPGRGLGATLTVRLPVLAAHRVVDAERRVRWDATTAADVTLRLEGVSVLLVEDDADGRQVLTMILELAGAKVAPAGSVREALALLDIDTSRPDVIVSDIGMPDEDGYTLIRRLRARDMEGGGSIPAVALTGYVRPEDQVRLLAAGFQAHVGKPVEPHEIVAAVASLVARPGALS